MSTWLRWYVGTTEDGKLRMVAGNARQTVATVTGVWAALLEDAAHDAHRGIATRGHDYYCAVLDVERPHLADILMEMETAGMIVVAPCSITINAWNDRQYETDAKDPTGADRQRRFKAKMRAATGETVGNGAVTVEKRPDTETDTDIKPPKPPLRGALRRSRKRDGAKAMREIFDQWEREEAADETGT